MVLPTLIAYNSTFISLKSKVTIEH